MSGPIELPPTYVIAYPEASASSGIGTVSTAARPPLTPYMTFIQDKMVRKAYANGPNMFTCANSGDVEGTLQACFSGFNGLTAAQVQNQLKMHADAQKWYLNSASQPGASNLTTPYAVVHPHDSELLYGIAYFKQADYAGVPNHYDFFGTALMPIAGIYYWLFGGGQTRYVNIGSLNLSMVPSDFKPVMDVVNSNGPGSYFINQGFEYNTFRFALNLWAAGLLGRISGTVTGTLNIAADGSWTFDGGFTLNPDRYDADHSNRSYMQEALTDFLRYLGNTYGSNDYQIVIEGSQSVHLSGHK